MLRLVFKNSDSVGYRVGQVEKGWQKLERGWVSRNGVGKINTILKKSERGGEIRNGVGQVRMG